MGVTVPRVLPRCSAVRRISALRTPLPQAATHTAPHPEEPWDEGNETRAKVQTATRDIRIDTRAARGRDRSDRFRSYFFSVPDCRHI